MSNLLKLVTVSYYRPGDHELSHEHLPAAQALELFEELKRPGSNRGYSPALIGTNWRASRGEDRRTGRPYWGMSFTADGIFKSLPCSIAERAGVRYASHRRGYRASDRAFSKFIARMVELGHLE